MGIPLHYKVQDGCHNCDHVYVRTDFDEDTKHFCCQDGPRPMSGSHLQGEDFGIDIKKRGIDIFEPEGFAELDRLTEAWVTWEETHKVHESGTCFCWKKKETTLSPS